MIAYIDMYRDNGRESASSPQDLSPPDSGHSRRSRVANAAPDGERGMRTPLDYARWLRRPLRRSLIRKVASRGFCLRGPNTLGTAAAGCKPKNPRMLGQLEDDNDSRRAS